MKLKLVTAILVLAALFSVVLWRVDRFVYGNRMAWAESQARSQVSSVSQAINAEIKSGRRMLSTVTNDTFKAESTNWRAFQPYYSLALMTSQNGLISMQRIVNRADSPAAGWTTNQLTQYLGFLGKDLEAKSTVILRSFKDPQKRRHVALIFAGSGTAYILVGSGENFQALIDSQKGSMSSFSIVATDGLTISHPVPEYVGNIMSDSTLLKEIRSTGAAQGLGTFQQGKTSVFGMYEKVSGTNAYVISTVPLDDLLRGRLSLAWQFVFLVVGLSLLGSAFYFWNERKQQGLPQGMTQPSAPAVGPQAAAMASPKPATTAAPMQRKAEPAKPVTAPSATPASLGHTGSVVVKNKDLVAPSAPRTNAGAAGINAAVNAGPLVSGDDIPLDKGEAFRQVATALGQEMRAPIASIVGFSQMVLSKTQDPDVVQAVESILREARSSRDVLEKLYTFSGQRNSSKYEGKIETAIGQALKKFETIFRDKGVTLEKDFKETSPWPMSIDDMSKVFENIFANAVEAMERMQTKVLKVSVWEDEAGLHSLVSDTGEGIAPENMQKIFDPFYTTRSFAHHVGLGLPVVYGILKEHHGEVQIKSSRGQGSQVEILILPEAKKAVPSSVLKAPPSAYEAPVARVPERTVAASALVETAAAETAATPKVQKLTDVNVEKLLDIASDDLPLEFLDGSFSDSTETAGRAPPIAPPPKPRMAPPPTQPPPAVSEIEPEVDPDKTIVFNHAAANEPATEAAKSAAPVELPPPPRFEIDEDEVTDPLYQMQAEPLETEVIREVQKAVPPKFVPDLHDAEEEEFVAGPKPSLPSRAPAIMPPPLISDELTPELPARAAREEAADEPTMISAPTVVIDKPAPRASAVPSALDTYKVEIRRPGKRS